MRLLQFKKWYNSNLPNQIRNHEKSRLRRYSNFCNFKLQQFVNYFIVYFQGLLFFYKDLQVKSRGMTTISNFIHNNFLEMPQQNQLPFWCLTFPRQLPFKDLREYFINHANTYNKCLLHIDLGISQLRFLRNSKQTQKTIKMQANDKITLVQPYQNKNYFIMQSSIINKSRPNFLQQLFNQLKSFFDIPQIKNISGNKGNDKKFGMFIEGIQTIQTLQKQSKSKINSQRLIESFLSDLSTLNHFAQITVLTIQKQLPLQVSFALQRVSSCVTKVLSNNTFNVWECSSTVRRQQTGFSNQQIYVIKIVGGRAKIQKKVEEYNERQTDAHKEMVNELGFKVQKGKHAEQLTQEEKQIRKMIYPHFQVQQQCRCSCKGNDCRKCNPASDYQGLIILDDEQQDDDDVDV